MIHVQIRLQGEQLRSLAEGDRDVKEPIRQQIENSLNTLTVNRAVMALERRLEESLNLRSTQLQGADWRDAEEEIMKALEDVLTKRMTRLVGEEGQVARDLDAAISHLEGDPLSDRNLISLLVLMAQGTRLAFDRKTHRQGHKRYNRLNYIYLSAHLLEGAKAEEITRLGLEHLEGARVAMGKLYGMVELKRLSQQEAKLALFDGRLREQFAETLGEKRYGELAELPLTELPEDARESVSVVLGTRLQNAIYRHLLLTVISDQWVDYLTKVEGLRVSIGLEAYAQRNPLVEYKAQASELFKTLLADVRMGVIRGMFAYRPRRGTEANVERERQESPAEEEKALQKGQPQAGQQPGGAHRKKRKRH
jgi:preprotein translocase subunit SecA